MRLHQRIPARLPLTSQVKAGCILLLLSIPELCLVTSLCKCDRRCMYCGTIFLHAECPCSHHAFLQPQQHNSSYNGRWPHSTIQSATWASSEVARLQGKQWMERLLATIPEGFKTIWMGFRHKSGSSGCQLEGWCLGLLGWTTSPTASGSSTDCGSAGETIWR